MGTAINHVLKARSGLKLWNTKVNLKLMNKVRIFDQRLNHSNVATDIGGNVKDVLHDISFFNKKVPLSYAVSEMIENLYKYHKTSSDLKKLSSRITFTADLTSSFYNSKMIGPCNKNVDFRKISRRSLGDMYNYIYNTSKIGGLGFPSTRQVFKKHDGIFHINKVKVQNKFETHVKMKLPKDAEFEKFEPDYFMGTWEIFSRPKLFDEPLQYIASILDQGLGYKHDTIRRIIFALREARNNSLQYGCWGGVEVEADVTDKGNLNKIISLSWRINKDYAQFIIKNPGEEFDPTEALSIYPKNPILSSYSRGRGLFMMYHLVDDMAFNFMKNENGESDGIQLIIGKENK